MDHDPGRQGEGDDPVLVLEKQEWIMYVCYSSIQCGCFLTTFGQAGGVDFMSRACCLLMLQDARDAQEEAHS
jgi:hypothetical protein